MVLDQHARPLVGPQHRSRAERQLRLAEAAGADFGEEGPEGRIGGHQGGAGAGLQPAADLRPRHGPGGRRNGGSPGHRSRARADDERGAGRGGVARVLRMAGIPFTVPEASWQQLDCVRRLGNRCIAAMRRASNCYTPLRPARRSSMRSTPSVRTRIGTCRRRGRRPSSGPNGSRPTLCSNACDAITPVTRSHPDDARTDDAGIVVQSAATCSTGPQ